MIALMKLLRAMPGLWSCYLQSLTSLAVVDAITVGAIPGVAIAATAADALLLLPIQG